MTRRISDRRRDGFTLVELLVVIAIVALLAGLALPALSGARRSAQAAHCLGQMRQIGIGAMLFANQNGNAFPRSQHSAFAHDEVPWAKAMAPFLGVPQADWRNLMDTLYRCPRDEETGRLSYGLNVYFELGPGDDYAGYPRTWRRRSDIPRPAATVLFAENNSFADHIMPNFWSGPRDAEDCAHDRHDGKANYIFADGHAEARVFTDIYDPARGTDAWHPDLAR